MGSLMLLVIIGTSIWVLVDAKSIGVKKGQIKGMGDLGPWGWFFVCLLLWIVGFPFYLAKRSEYKKINSTNDTIQTNNELTGSSGVRPQKQNSSDIDQLEKLADLKEKGVITEEEFQAKKKELLGL